MKKLLLILVALTGISFMGFEIFGSGDYQGTESCKMCHSGTLGTFPGYEKFSQTLHTTIHLPPSKTSMIGDFSKDVDMGASFANAKVGFRIEGNDYFIVFKPVTGNPVEYKVVYTYGQNWKQRYLVKIENSYYMPPVQWNLKGYKDNASGTWVTYNPANWWNADGSLKPINNAFRTKSWDKNCAGCHVVPGSKLNTVQKTVNGADTAWVYKWANNNSALNIVVGCESCHGYPTKDMGAGHINNLKNLSYDRKLDVCGQCHTRGKNTQGSYEYPYDETTGKTYPIGEDYMNYYKLIPGLWPDGEARQHHQQWIDFKMTGHYNAEKGITCTTCHDPHQNTNQHFQLKEDFRTPTTGQGCVKCHSDKMVVANGKNTHSKHTPASTNCVACHMPKVAGSGVGYDISAHSMNVISPEKTIKYKDVTTPAKGNPNSCALSCHRNGKGTFGSGKDFGVTDATLSDWTQATDITLADSLLKYYKLWYSTDVIEKIDNSAKMNSISTNTPNPFLNNTTIYFDVAKTSNIKIEVYDMTGNLINVLVNNTMDQGSYFAIWDGKSVGGYHLSSGNYYCVMTSNGKIVGSRNLQLIK